MNATYATWNDYYKHEIARHFGFLLRDHGFVLTLPSEANDIRSVVFQFRNGTIVVELWIEQGTVPYVIVENTASGEPQRLDNLVKKRCPNRAVKRPKGFCGPEINRRQFIESYGRILKDHFSDFLVDL